MALTRSPMRRTYRQTGPSGDVVEVVAERAHWSCEICGGGVGDRRGEDWSIHHRSPRQMGGSRLAWKNLPANLLLVCGSATTGCHSVIESHRSGAVAAGWLILHRADPQTVAVLLRRESWVYLDNSGTYRDAPPSFTPVGADEEVG